METNKESIRVAFVGLGDRGRTALRLMTAMPEVEVAALCDTIEANVQAARAFAQPATCCMAGADSYKTVCRLADVDLVYICSDWESHSQIALAALEAGKHVAVEVPAALTIDDLTMLLATARRVQKICFMLENCCFDSQLLKTIDDIRQGAIGEIVHAEGSYYHELADRWTPWRLEMNRRLKGDLYPTHEIGPICKALNIGTDDRLATLVSMDSAAVAGPRAYQRSMQTEAADFSNGDHTTTLIRTQRGRTIILKHDVQTKQPYERRLTFIGTKGRITLDDAGKTSHEEMSAAMNRHLVDVLLHGCKPQVSLEEMATWCSIIPLSSLSIERGYAPVQVPEFG